MTNSRNAGVTTQKDILTSDFTTTSTTQVDVTGMSITLPNNNGKSLVAVVASADVNTSAQYHTISIYDGASGEEVRTYCTQDGAQDIATLIHIAENDGQTVKVQVDTVANTLTIEGVTDVSSSYFTTMEFS